VSDAPPGQKVTDALVAAETIRAEPATATVN